MSTWTLLGALPFLVLAYIVVAFAVAGRTARWILARTSNGREELTNDEEAFVFFVPGILWPMWLVAWPAIPTFKWLGRWLVGIYDRNRTPRTRLPTAKVVTRHMEGP